MNYALTLLKNQFRKMKVTDNIFREYNLVIQDFRSSCHTHIDTIAKEIQFECMLMLQIEHAKVMSIIEHAQVTSW